MLKVLLISECFPNAFKPMTCEFILRHAEALSLHCRVKVLAPLRLTPPREAITGGMTGIRNWRRKLMESKGYVKGNLEAEYLPYASLPRPAFETVDNFVVKAAAGGKLRDSAREFSPDIICCHWLRPWAGTVSEIAGKLNVPLVIDHHEDLPTLKGLFPGAYKKFLRPMTNAECIIVHSTANRNDLLDELPDLKRVELVYLGQSMETAAVEKEFRISIPHLITVSHLHEPRKKIDILLKAVSIVRKSIDFKLTVIGDGPLKSGYMNLARELKLNDSVTFAGELSQSDIKAALDDSDLFILPSFPEAFGIVIIEALARGVPALTCIGSGGGEELRALGYPDVMVTPDSPQCLAEKIISIINDQRLKIKMSAIGKTIVSKHFTWAKNAVSTYSVLESLRKSYNC